MLLKNSVGVPVSTGIKGSQRLSYYDYYLFTVCFLFQNLKGLYYVIFTVRPVVALAHHGATHRFTH